MGDLSDDVVERWVFDDLALEGEGLAFFVGFVVVSVVSNGAAWFVKCRWRVVIRTIFMLAFAGGSLIEGEDDG